MRVLEIEIHQSVQLAWLIANHEAVLCDHDCVTPAHALLGVLKILDDSYRRVAETLELGEDELRQTAEMAAACRPLLHLSESELSAARRGLHKILHEHGGGQTPVRARMLKWSGEAFYLHQRSIARAVNNGLQVITLAHLLEELLENLPAEALPFFRNHPTARSSHDSSATSKGQVKYDSPFWNADDESD